MERGRHPILVLLRNCLPSVPPSTSVSEPDVFLWKTDPTSQPCRFSTTKTWSSLHPSPASVPWYKSIWFTNHIPKHAFNLWVAVQDRLPTRDRLCSWGLNVPVNCLLCGDDAETRSHIFFTCAYSSQVWTSFFTHQDLNPPLDFDSVISWVKSSHSLPNLRLICKLILHAVVYFLWKERNYRLHSSTPKVSQSLVKEIQLLLRAKLAGLDRSSALAGSSRVSSSTLLYSWFEYIQR